MLFISVYWYEASIQLKGVAVNEPVTYAIRTAIEFAVLEIIHAGEQKKYWKFKKEEIGIHNNVQTN